MPDEKQMTGAESLQLITEMIGRVKSTFNGRGSSAILWGSVVGFCGIAGFAQSYFGFSIGFDVTWLIFIAVIPQIIIGIRERKERVVRTHQEAALDIVWGVFGISMIAMLLYLNLVPGIAKGQLMDSGTELLQRNIQTGEIKARTPFILSAASLTMIIYAFPTLVTGWLCKFKPMLYGAIACYIMFVISLFTTGTWDMLLNGLAGIVNWLIPGIILRNKYLKGKQAHV